MPTLSKELDFYDKQQVADKAKRATKSKYYLVDFLVFWKKSYMALGTKTVGACVCVKAANMQADFNDHYY